MSELSDLITIGNSIVENPNDTIIKQRIAVVNFFSKFHAIACGDWPEGLRKQIYNACTSKPIVEDSKDDFNGIEECTGARLLSKVLMITEAVYNIDIYDRLNDVIIRLSSWEYNSSTNTWLPKNDDDYMNATQELWNIILKMTNLIYKKRIFGYFLNCRLKI